MKSCEDNNLLQSFFDVLADDALLVVQIDTAERGEAGYDINEPLRTKDTDWKEYCDYLYKAVEYKISNIIPETYRNQVLTLERIRFGSLSLDPALSRGDYRALTEDEIKHLRIKE